MSGNVPPVPDRPETQGDGCSNLDRGGWSDGFYLWISLRRHAPLTQPVNTYCWELYIFFS